MLFWVVALLMFLVAIVFSTLGAGWRCAVHADPGMGGDDFHTAAATSLFLIMVVSLSASLVFRRAEKIDWPLDDGPGDSHHCGRIPGWLVLGERFPVNCLSVLFALVVVVAGLLDDPSPLDHAADAGAGRAACWSGHATWAIRSTAWMWELAYPHRFWLVWPAAWWGWAVGS